MEELEKDAEIIRKHFDEECVQVKIYESVRPKTLRIDLDDCGIGGDICGNEFEYSPDPVAPAKWEPVFVFWPPSQNSDFEVYRAFSLGRFHENGNLIVQYGDQEEWSTDWCSVNNRNHHSPGWKKEWEPTE